MDLPIEIKAPQETQKPSTGKAKEEVDFPGKNSCWDCKYLNQGQHSCRCYHPVQKDQYLIQYTNPHFLCDLFSKGNMLTPTEMEQIGHMLIELPELPGQWSYYKHRDDK